jgi:hypothetical protein
VRFGVGFYLTRDLRERRNSVKKQHVVAPGANHLLDLVIGSVCS